MLRFLLLLLLPGTMLAQHQMKTESTKAIKAYDEAMAFYRQDQFLMAERSLQQAIKADSNFQNAYLVLAEVYWDMEHYGLAISAYDKGLSLDPSFYPMGYYNKGKLERQTGRYDEAVQSYLV